MRWFICDTKSKGTVSVKVKPTHHTTTQLKIPPPLPPPFNTTSFPKRHRFGVYKTEKNSHRDLFLT